MTEPNREPNRLSSARMGFADRIHPSDVIDTLPSRLYAQYVAGAKSTCKSWQQTVTDICRSGIQTRQGLDGLRQVYCEISICTLG